MQPLFLCMHKKNPEFLKNFRMEWILCNEKISYATVYALKNQDFSKKYR